MSAPGTPPMWMRLLPRRALSRFVGGAARTPLPGWMLRPLLRMYGKAYGVQWHEMARPLKDYEHVVDFFTRRLKPGVRPMPDDELAIACPADGRIAQSGSVEAGTLVQAKGLTYTVGELLSDEDATSRYAGGTFAVVYLAPGDYHRFHWPFDAEVARVVHQPGDLWPVNKSAVATVPRLFARNERVIVEGTTQGAPFAFVAVGALNVGSIRLAFHDLRTNRGARATTRTWHLEDPSEGAGAKRGDELGWFELGSTVVVVLSASAGALTDVPAGTRCLVGDAIGSLTVT